MEGLAGFLGTSCVVESTRNKIRKLLERQGGGQRLPAIFIQGETGTGKSMIARALHQASARARAPFVVVNCAAIPEALLESELFGHERGAFTDARTAKAGLFQSAHGGSLFLDEIGFLPEALQAKLLTAVEDRAVRRLGSTRAEQVDVWLVSATSMDVDSAVADGRFLEPLYHRLSVITISLPPLRERGSDVVTLAEHFLVKACADYGLGHKRLSAEARAALLAYAWPGNVRELGNVIERAALLADGNLLTPAALGLQAAPQRGAAVASLTDDDIVQALEKSQGNLSRAAALLRVPRNSLRYRMTKAQERKASEPAAPPPARDSLRWERQVLAMLRVEVVAAPREGDPLEGLVDKVQAFGGRVEELGPAELVAVFGLDAVDDPGRRAAHAARALVRAAPADSLRVGLHAGPILVGHSRAAPRMDVDGKRALERALDPLLGGTPGAVYVTPAAAALLRRRFDIVADGPALRLEGAERAGFAHTVELIGRVAELELLAARWRAAAAGQGQVVVLVGDAGIGKSRLLYELRRRCDPPACLEGRCQAYGATVPYLPFVGLVRQACAITDCDGDAAIAKKVAAQLERLGMPAEGAGFLLQILGTGEAAQRLAGLSPESVRARPDGLLRQLLLRTAARSPLLLVVEDLHWIDQASEALLGSLVDDVPAAPALLCVSYRPGRPPLSDRSHVTQIALRPLTPRESAGLVERLLPEAAAAPLVAAIVDRAQGNALFLEELARAAAETGATASVPDSVQAVIEERIGRLPETPRRLLRAAALLGREFTPRVLAGIWSEGDVEPALAELRRAELVHECGDSDERVHVFKHALVQQAAYEGLLPAERQALHGAAGRALEDLYRGRREQVHALLAHHFQRSASPEKAFEYLVLANQHAIRTNALEAAYAHFQDAAALYERLPATADIRRRWLDLLVNQDPVMIALVKVGEYRELLLRHESTALELGDRGLLAGTYATLGLLDWMVGRFDAGVANAERAIAYDAAACNPHHDGHGMLAWNLVLKGDLLRAIGLEGAILEGVARWKDALGKVGHLGALMFAHEALGRHRRALALGETALAAAEDADDASAISLASWHLSRAHNFAGDVPAALTHAERSVATALGPAPRMWASCNLAWAWARGGAPDRAVEVLAPAVGMIQQIGAVSAEPFAAYLGEAYFLLGDRDHARGTFADVLAVCDRHGMKHLAGVAHRWLGELAPDPTDARAHLDQAIAMLSAIHADEELGRARAAARALG